MPHQVISPFREDTILSEDSIARKAIGYLPTVPHFWTREPLAGTIQRLLIFEFRIHQDLLLGYI